MYGLTTSAEKEEERKREKKSIAKCGEIKHCFFLDSAVYGLTTADEKEEGKKKKKALQIVVKLRALFPRFCSVWSNNIS